MRVVSNGLQLEVETLGRQQDPAIVLITGLGNQLIHWPLSFCEQLARAGHYVVRFDNRDAGKSSAFRGAGGRPNIAAAWIKQHLGIPQRSAYRLDDMAADTVGLLNALGLQQVHLVGLSMGGMIAQIVAARHPERVSRLSLLMTSSGARGLPGPRLEVQRQMISRPTRTDRDGLIRHSVKTWRMISSPAYPPSEQRLYAQVAQSFDRRFYPAGVLRQMHAIMASGSRRALLKQITAPTLVLHGEADPLVPVACGRDLARTLPNARLVTIPGWAHDLPPPLLPRLAQHLIAHSAASLTAEQPDSSETNLGGQQSSC